MTNEWHVRDEIAGEPGKIISRRPLDEREESGYIVLHLDTSQTLVIASMIAC